MTYTTAIILNAVFALAVLAGLARIVWFGIGPGRREPSVASIRYDERETERLAA
jgi:hypothetical protein